MGRIVKKKERKPLIVICSEGGKKSSEYYYFRNFATRDLRIQFPTGNSTDPEGMLQDLLKYMDNEDIKSEDDCKIYFIIDTDLDNNRIQRIKEYAAKCQKYNIEIITSAPTFEIWYIMHFRNNNLYFNNSSAVKREMSKIIGKDYQESMDLFKALESKMSFAMETAKAIKERIIRRNESYIDSNPHTCIPNVIEYINRKLQ
jgi:hypothetical protein